jgi:TetR/AcrR family tetracycline transcriptional repressor
VVAAALELADAHGLDALSMPNLARLLGCGVMTLYGYINSKDDLLDAIAQRGLEDVHMPRPLVSTPAGVLLAWGRALRAVLLLHPSLATIFLAHPVIGPGIFRGVEGLLTALGRLEMAPADALRAIYAVLIYTTGFVAWELPRTHQQSEAEYAATWRREFASLPAEQFPLTATLLGDLATLASAQQFEIGLTALAAGLTSGALGSQKRGRRARRAVQNSATGLSGEPVPPGTTSGSTISINS